VQEISSRQLFAGMTNYRAMGTWYLLFCASGSPSGIASSQTCNGSRLPRMLRSARGSANCAIQNPPGRENKQAEIFRPLSS
jgi:hypothetical protein